MSKSGAAKPYKVVLHVVDARSLATSYPNTRISLASEHGQ